jgi:hypothetical protein
MKLSIEAKFLICLGLLLIPFILFGCICAINHSIVDTYASVVAPAMALLFTTGFGGSLYYGFNLGKTQ